MQEHKNDYQISDENSTFELSILSVLGDRSDQQDSAGYELRTTDGIVTVCDGMGGHAGGKLASSIAVETILSEYKANYPCEQVVDLLLDCAKNIDRRIAELKNSVGKLLRAGTTVVTVVVKDGYLYWLSVGDSRIYIYRNDEFVQITHDHTYQSVLDTELEMSRITEDEYKTQSLKGEALISFLGVGGLPQFDVNQKAFQLKNEDRIILMSDGLYKLLSDAEISSVLSNFGNVTDALNALEMKAKRKAKNTKAIRDNMTIAILKIK